MDPLNVIVSAIVGGAAAAGKDIGGQAVKDAYNGLKSLITRKAADPPAAEAALAVVEQAPPQGPDPQEVARRLGAARVEPDPEILEAARALLSRLASQGMAPEWVQQARVNGGGAIAQGIGAVAVGEGGTASSGGIRARTIKADNVVDGVLMEGGDPSAAEGLIALAKSLARGGISADSIEAQKLVSGLHYIQDPKSATPADLHREIGAFREQLDSAVAAGEIPDADDAEELQTAVVKAETELAKPEPQGNKVVRWLSTATTILNSSAETAQAAGKLQAHIIKLAPTAAVIYTIARGLFG